MATSPYHPVTLHPQEARLGHRYVWELPIRYTHLVMALSITTLIATGFFITYPVFGPPNGEPYDHFVMGRFRQIHFVAGGLLLLSFLTRVYWFFMGNKYARSGMAKFWDLNWYKIVVNQMIEYMKVERGHAHMGHNSLAGASYVFQVGGVGVFQIITGFAMYGEGNPGGFWDRLCGWVIPLLGGSYRTHVWHHFASWVFVIFIIVHLYMTIFGSLRFKNGLVSSIIRAISSIAMVTLTMTDTLRPVLVLGLGNQLLSDDAVGLKMLETLEAESTDDSVEFVDGGTQGIALCGYFANRSSVLVLDAVGLGAAPGTVHVLRGDAITDMRAKRAATPHEGNGLGVIEVARLLGDLPEDLAVVGVEAANIRTGIGLSAEVEGALGRALEEARGI